MSDPTCPCLQPATEQVDTGWVNRGGRWVLASAWLCPECKSGSDRERVRGLAS